MEFPENDPEEDEWVLQVLGDGATHPPRLEGRAPVTDEPGEPDVHDVSDMADVPDESALLAALVARVMRQDEAALAELYQRLVNRVYSTALHLTRNPALAEEVTETAFWQVWRQAPRFDPTRGSVTAWVLNITRSRALDALRALRRTPGYEGHVDAQDESGALCSDAQDDPMDLLELAQNGTRLHEALLQLDPMRRQLIALAYFRDMTQEQIAAHVQMPLGTVKSHMRRTLSLLRVALGETPSRRPLR